MFFLNWRYLLKAQYYKENFCKEALIPAVLFTLLFSFSCNPFDGIEITIFDRSISRRTMTGTSAVLLSQNFYIFYIGLVLGLFFIFGALICFLYSQKNRYDDKVQAVINNISGLSFITMIPLLFLYFSRASQAAQDWKNFIAFPAISIVAMFMYYLVTPPKLFNANWLKWSQIVAFSLYFPFQVILQVVFQKSCNLMLLYAGLSITCALIVSNTCPSKSKSIVLMQKTFMPVTFFVVAIFVFLEVVNILNQYNIFVVHRTRYVVLIFLFILLMCGMIFWSERTTIGSNSFKWEKYYYIGILLSMLLLSARIPLVTYSGQEFFEAANGAASVSQFFYQGEIPFIDNIGAHLMSDYLYKLAFGVINNSGFSGILFACDGLIKNSIFLFALYFLLKESFDRDFAFFTVLIFPFGNIFVGLEGTLVCTLALFYLLKHENVFFAHVLFWASMAFQVLYKLDSGISYGIGAICAYIIFHLVKKKKINWFFWVGGFVGVSGALILLAIILCAIRGVDFAGIVQQLYLIFGATVDFWSYSTVGDVSSLAYQVFYVLMPFTAMFFTVYFVYKLAKEKNEKFVYFNIISITFLLAYIINWNRMLARHCLAESSVAVLVIPLALLVPYAMAMVVSVEKRKICFLSTLGITVSVGVALVTGKVQLQESVLKNATMQFWGGSIIYSDIETIKKERVEVHPTILENSINIVDFLNENLSEKETFLDFTNQSLLYSLTKKDNPSYANQSPSLTGHTPEAQEQLISSWDKYKDFAPIALLPINSSLSQMLLTDGINSAIRQYKLAEYLYKNFEPFCSIDDFAVWTRKDSDKRFDNKMQTSDITTLTSEKVSNWTWKNITDVVLQGNSLTIKSEEGDPGLLGIENLLNALDSNMKFVQIEIFGSTTENEKYELFYTEKEGEFNQEDSIEQYFKQGKINFFVPYNSTMRYRLDVPQNCITNITKIVIEAHNLNKIDYFYGSSSKLHRYDLELIPYLWGMKDERAASNNPVIKKSVIKKEDYYELNLNDLQKQNGNYISIILEAPTVDENDVVTLNLVSANDVPTSLAYFSGKIVNGTNQYLFRVSADFLWYSGEINGFRIDVPENVTINDVQIIEGD